MYTKIANYIYDIFEITRANNLPDLTLGLAHLRADKEIPEGVTDRQLRTFMSDKYKVLTHLFAQNDRELFVEVAGYFVEKYLAPSEDVIGNV